MVRANNSALIQSKPTLVVVSALSGAAITAILLTILRSPTDTQNSAYTVESGSLRAGDNCAAHMQTNSHSKSLGRCDEPEVRALRIRSGFPASDRVQFKYEDHSYQFAVHPKMVNDFVSEQIRNHGLYGDMQVLVAATKKVKAEGRELGMMLDCGANIGLYTMLAHSLGYPKIVSVEASDINFARLQENVMLNQATETTVFKVAVSDRSECVEMAAGWHKIGGDGINLGGNAVATAGTKESADELEPVYATTLDELVPHGGPQINFAKLDVEGSECKALRGGRRLFADRRVEVLYMEVYPKALENLGCSVTQLGEILRALCMDIDAAGWKPDFFEGTYDLTMRPMGTGCVVPEVLP